MSNLMALFAAVIPALRRKPDPPQIAALPVPSAPEPSAQGVGSDPPPPAQTLRIHPPKVIPTYVLAHKFAIWMRKNSGEGYYLVSEIDMLIEAFCEKFNFDVPGQQEFRSCLAETRGVTRGRYRLKSWEFREVARRTTIEKPVLYRISSNVVSETVSSDFYAELANGRPMGEQGQCEGSRGRPDSVHAPATRQRRAYPKRKMVLQQEQETVGNREIERRAA